MNEKISLAGDLGSGKSTVADILIRAIGAEYYSTGAIVREIANKRGMSVVELNVYMETHPEIDNEIDDGLKALAFVDKPLVIDSRMAWHFTEGTFKVYLSTDPETSALRIMSANRAGEHSATLEQTIADTKARRESEKKRYMTQYGVDIMNLSNYNLVVDTTASTPDEVARYILSSFEEWKRNPALSVAYISAERINFPDDEADGNLVGEYAVRLERGERIPEVEIAVEDGEFFVVGDAEPVLAHALNMQGLIPCRIVKLGVSGRKYVKMKNSL